MKLGTDDALYCVLYSYFNGSVTVRETKKLKVSLLFLLLLLFFFLFIESHSGFLASIFFRCVRIWFLCTLHIIQDYFSRNSLLCSMHHFFWSWLTIFFFSNYAKNKLKSLIAIEKSFKELSFWKKKFETKVLVKTKGVYWVRGMTNMRNF